MKKTIIYLFLFLLTGTRADEVIQVVAGQQKTIEIGQPVDILMGNSETAILDYTSGTKGVLIGRSPGLTSLTLRYQGGREVTKTIQVIARNPKQIISQLKELLKDSKSLTYRIAGAVPIIEGEISSPEEVARFEKVIPLFPDVLNLVKKKQPTMMIGVSVKVIEINLSKSHDFKPFGSDVVSLNASYQSDGRSDNRNILVTLNAQLLPKIEYWLANGMAQLVADPIITAINKEKAYFQIGGEIPYEYNTQDGKAVEWKKYGVILDIVPEWLESDEIRLDLEGEVSSVDDARQTSRGVPGIKIRKIKTTVAIKNRESIIISGIKYKESSVHKKRIPVLGHLLPFLFYQRSTKTEDKELIIIVSPTTPAKIDMDEYNKIKAIKQR
jgi:pilus assembly protein CpaC